MGKIMIRVGGLFIVNAREKVGMMYEYEKPFVVDSSKFEKASGPKTTQWTKSIKATVGWYKAHPQLNH